VLRDADERYSISGQMARMEHSIGRIYLGMDDGPEYRKQSGVVNQALMQLTAADGFELAFRAANRKLDAIRDEAIEKAGLGGTLHYEVAIDAREVVDEVLAALSDAWFGLKGSPHFTRGSADWDWQDEDPSIYPGHFIALSRYMFQPHPGPVPGELARRYGQALQRSMRRFVADLRKHLADDAAFRLAPVTDAVFRSPYGNDDEYAARTMAGVIMGFTPPITGALLNLLREWARDGRFWRLRGEAAVDPASLSTYASASQLVAGDLRDATGMRPMPQIIWRTARKPHRLGPAGAHAVDVEVGDILVLGLVSGTQQSLADGSGDGDRLMFGGVRSLTGPHPTHACPGFEAGMGAMVGTLAAMLSRQEQLRQGAGPFAYEMRGDVPVEEELQEVARAFMLDARGRLAGEGPFGRPGTIGHMSVRTARRAPKGLILAWGDSWLDFAQPLGDQNTDLVNCLTDLGYQVNDDTIDDDPFCNWKDWLMLATMADDIRANDLRAGFLAFVRARLGQKPRAVLLSGGGNDSVRTPLFNILNEKGTAAGAVNVPALERHVAGLLEHYKVIVDGINRVCQDAKVDPLPVLVHGYDNPLPFFKNFGVVPYNLVQFPWLQKPFIDRKYTDPGDPRRADVAVGARAMVEIMEELNRMLREDLVRAFPNVHYVKLTGTLQAYWKDQKEIGWSDNMHPNIKGFQALAAKVAEKIEAVAPQFVVPAAVQAGLPPVPPVPAAAAPAKPGE
jgi:lysophospholipase L1-like esterase